MRRWSWIAAVLGLIVLVSPAVLRLAGPDRETTRSEFALDTIVTITAGGPGSERAVAAAFAEINRVERLLSSYHRDAEIARVNKAAGIGPVAVTTETFQFVERMLAYSRRLGGAFDPTVGPLVILWGFGGENPAIPRQAAIAGVLPLVGAAKVTLDRSARTVFLPLLGMRLDVGGALKGYAVDRAISVLRSQGVRYAMVDAGSSSIKVLGSRRGRPWVVGVAHPRKAGALLGTIVLRDGEAIGTSADTNRFFVAGGVRYSHLIDPRTGWPARYNQLVTVKTRSAFAADAYSKTFVLETGRVLPSLASLRATGLVVASDGRVFGDLPGFSRVVKR